jgi:hypothetical protein
LEHLPKIMKGVSKALAYVYVCSHHSFERTSSGQMQGGGLTIIG